ncbi:MULTISPECIES: LacI family transcriptional regulator [Rhizobium]|uniref:LacI family transcriptional regulator n=1 Tax=Rhizobium wenxiniae TaxID=1737357 RepID=A0A7W9Y459_9HYPH|nr:LacI family transcriptional regulator [Rhizobium wenxiniae]MBB6161674.1 LacI family transcriptional regulator [Rhizobium wenxiniae]GGF90701.1 LacI family transcriptional regulator [Rhizobium wenxiniae]
MSLDDAEDGRQPNAVGPSTSNPGSHRKPTLKTIAELTGLAVTTVSRALGDDPLIARETRQRVQAAAAQVGYLPDRAAQRLRTGRTNVISLVLDPHEEILGYGTSMIRGMTATLRGTPYHLVITPHFSDTPQIDPVRHIVRNRMADGILFSRTEPSDERVKFLMETGFPFVCHGRTELATPHPYVDYDNYRFTYEAAKKLIASGCRRLFIILPPERFTFHQHMRHGFMTAVREEGIGFEIAQGITLDSKADAVRDHVAERLARADPPDGFICGGEVSAMAVMSATHDLGLEIGRDVRLVAKQTSGLFDQVRPRIETIYEDLSEAGRLMASMLLKRMAGAAPVSELQAVLTV